ncbi:hypothetical protein AJ79_02723 [Helicocarpus griseus UAMH5409]|uniref:Alpha/beta hydrolase fold-3 domain-containing protein n=1 Tax=Helicocarpus griseus UAMH5409 TaxID=1447875 RepID=A0A2B7Y1X0_9EURO|nr:hypothetical protein AJ79_02723 [Helicocarpus griseus UAMH5409]
MAIETAASRAYSPTVKEKVLFYILIPVFVIRLLAKLTFESNKALHWRQMLAANFLQAQRATFPATLITSNLRRTPSGKAIECYCAKHGIPYKAVTLEKTPDESKDASRLPVPPAALHFVTPPSATANGPTMLYFHGGGYVNPLRSAGHLPFVLRCAAACKAKEVVFLEYALAPEHQYPAQLVQAVATLRYFLHDLSMRAEDIVIAGDSAGGHLAGSLLAHIVKPSPYAPPLDLAGGQLRAVLFVSPFTMLGTNQGSYRTNDGRDYLNWIQVVRFRDDWNADEKDAWADICGGDGADIVWRKVFPASGQSAGLVKKAMVTAGSAEVLLDSCRVFATDCVKAEAVCVRRGADWSVFYGKDFVYAECEGEVHVQPALDSAMGYEHGAMMQAIMRWLESV